MTIAQSMSPAEEKDRTRHLILLLSVWSMAISLIVRGYVFAEAPLPPTSPLPWFLGALAQDAAVLGAVAIISLLATIAFCFVGRRLRDQQAQARSATQRHAGA